jgi:hypothetical protein
MNRNYLYVNVFRIRASLVKYKVYYFQMFNGFDQIGKGCD